MLINIINYHCLSHSKCRVCCIKVFIRSLDIFCFVELCLCALYLNATVERFFNYLKIVKTEWWCRLNDRNIEFLLHIKVEGPELKDAAEKIHANTDTLWWNSKERHTSQQKHKNYIHRNTKQKPRRFTNTYIDEFLSNISSMDNDSNDLYGERSDSNNDILID